jgi:L-asparagine transporter-like permease
MNKKPAASKKKQFNVSFAEIFCYITLIILIGVSILSFFIPFTINDTTRNCINWLLTLLISLSFKKVILQNNINM